MIRLELLLQTEYVLRFRSIVETNLTSKFPSVAQLPGCEMLLGQVAFCGAP